jgi:anti-sigma factor RsiW
VTNRGFNEHLSAERIQAFLEGDLAASEHTRTGEHIAQCARCSEELEAWRVLFEDLTELRSLRPHEGFADRVMSEVAIPEPLPLVARARERIRSVTSSRVASRTCSTECCPSARWPGLSDT